MRLICKMVVVTAVAFAAHGVGVQSASAEPESGSVSRHAPSSVAPKTRHRIARVHRHTSPKNVIIQTDTPPAPAAEEPVFLSDAWVKREKETDDRLKRFMNICKGC